MSEKRYRGVAALCVAIALVAGVAAATGIFGRGSGETASAVSIRGEAFEYVTDGVYAYNAERIVAEGVGWDIVTLFLAVPALLLSVRGVYLGRLRGRLLALGLLGYVFYQYFMYAMFWALGPLFPVFIVLFVAAAVAIVWLVDLIDVPTLPERFSDRFPRKGMAVLSIAVALLLVGMWTKLIAAALSGNIDGVLYGGTTLSVQALDLGIVVPIAVTTAVLLWRNRPWGYALAAGLAVKGVTMAGAICAMLVVAALVEGSLDVAGFTVFAVIALVCGGLGWRILSSVKPLPAT